MSGRAPALGAALWLLFALPAAALAQDPETEPERPSHARAHWLIAGGIALSGLSFVFAEAADDAYASYLNEFDGARLQEDYDRAVRLDRLGSAALLVGQAALAAGIYLRFVQKPPRASRRSESSGLGSQLPSHGPARGPERIAPAAGEPAGFTWIADVAAPRLGIAYRF